MVSAPRVDDNEFPNRHRSRRWLTRGAASAIAVVLFVAVLGLTIGAFAVLGFQLPYSTRRIGVTPA